MDDYSTVLESICAFREFFALLLVAQTVLLLLAIFSVFGEKSRQAGVVLQFDLVIILSSIALMVGALVVCRRYDA